MIAAEDAIALKLTRIFGREAELSLLLESLSAHLRGRQALPVLDNCEHVLRQRFESAEAVQVIARRAHLV